MTSNLRVVPVGFCLALVLASCSPPGGGPPVAPDPLPSWNDGPSRRAIESFVADVTTPQSPSFVPESDRIAVFDNDGTLWSETPVYVQLAFVMDRVAELAPEHPEWRTAEPFRAVLENDREALARLDHHDLLDLILATHADMTTDEFDAAVRAWLADARHPVRDRPYTDLAYRPMLELLDYLRANGFRTFIVSGGGIEFMRPWTQEVYGIPPEQVVGSSIEVRYAVEDGRPVLRRLPQIDFIDDGAGKPVGIHRHVGRRPLLACGNSDGDFEMLEWTTSGNGARLGLIVHHDDDERESAYDRDSAVGRLARGLDEAGERGWIVVSMKDDWKTVFGEED